jgi:16S rRNA (guanine527-N7)-methyltransferase
MIIDEPRLRQLMTAFLEENAKLNLSAFRTEEHCWVGNILDSLALLRAAEEIPFLSDAKKLLDIGTGGGFPLLPLALCLPDVRCVGIDATMKKVEAVRHIISAVGIQNAELMCGRLEELGHRNDLRETFDIVTARAVAPLPVLLEYAAPFLKVGAVAAFWKSTRVANELASSSKAQQVLGMPFLRIYQYDLGKEWGERTIVFFRKQRATPEAYPRRTGVAKTHPL